MSKLIKPAIGLFGFLSVLTGIIYPLAVTGIARWVFPEQAKGSLILEDGRALGSALIGQPFSDPKYFWGRPSATSPFPYNAAASSGSNLGPLNPALLEAVEARVETLRQSDPSEAKPIPAKPIPVDLVTASGSGLDPHISPAGAEYQVNRVAAARGLDAEGVRKLVANHTEGRQLGILGEPRVNVLRLNLALDAPPSLPYRMPGRGASPQRSLHCSQQGTETPLLSIPYRHSQVAGGRDGHHVRYGSPRRGCSRASCVSGTGVVSDSQQHKCQRMSS
jgi:K+-transporting ATPase ATPase C chain